MERISIPNEVNRIYPIGKGNLWGFADEKGNIVIDYKFEKVNFFSSGLAGAQIDGKYGFINRIGKFEIKPKFDSVDVFRTSSALVFKDGKSFWINRKGNKINEYFFRESGGCNVPSKASKPLNHFTKIENKFKLIETEINQIKRLDPTTDYFESEFIFDDIIPFSTASVIVKKKDKYGIYVHYNWVGLKDLWVDEIIPIYQTMRFDTTLYEANNAKIRIGEKWGLVSDFGNLLIEPEFYSLEESTDILFLVEYKKNHWGHMSTSNRYFPNEDE